MKASEVIDRLKSLQEEHGDREVRFLNDDHDWFIRILNIDQASVMSIGPANDFAECFVLNYE